MTKSFRRSLAVTVAALGVLLPAAGSTFAQGITHYVRYTDGVSTSYGILDGQTIRELDGDLFANSKPTGRTH